MHPLLWGGWYRRGARGLVLHCVGFRRPEAHSVGLEIGSTTVEFQSLALSEDSRSRANPNHPSAHCEGFHAVIRGYGGGDGRLQHQRRQLHLRPQLPAEIARQNEGLRSVQKPKAGYSSDSDLH